MIHKVRQEICSGTVAPSMQIILTPNSLQGLSMYLFVSAFLGNFFYVLSILSSPNMRGPLTEASTFLSESMP
jgi:hypothetical protein